MLSFDWHSSEVATVVTVILKHSLTVEEHYISVAGGKGKNLIKLKLKSQF